MKKTQLLIALMLPISLLSQNAKYAEDVIRRYAGDDVKLQINISLPENDGHDTYSLQVNDNTIFIDASSGVAACRGFYDYVKKENAGIVSWSGNRCELPEHLNACDKYSVVSPFKHHYYFNVVTYGYTMPYWDWERWEKEIDWMALHGIDMPLALVANEAISARVWKKLGLSDDEINNYFVGPAHFPWMRMGNISGIDGPLPESWHDSQIELQHKILDRMKALGMKPICPGFAGFVPKDIERLYPQIELIETSWCDGAFHNWMVSPDNELFQYIGQLFIEEWEKEFGKNDFYIVDSFNEMDIPFPEKGSPERYSMIAEYGNNVYQSIKGGNPDATWVMQGWMFGYQRHIWDYETLAALVSKVPDDKMLLLDLAVDYNKCFWKTETNWDFYKGFFNKEWVYSVIPNMGGKTGLTGILDFYANGRIEALESPNKGRLAGYGMAPEGLENNEVIYELICDAGWTNSEINVEEWIENYSLCRYGTYNEHIEAFWKEMRKSVYGSFTDHPRFNWQFRPGTVVKGSINANDNFFTAVENLSLAIPDSENSPLFRIDMIEMTAHYLGAKMEILVQEIDSLYATGNMKEAKKLRKQFVETGLYLDRLLESHHNLKLSRWIDFAKSHGNTDEEMDYYERNARRIVTVWGPPVDDYSARIWSGLIRDYYIPRWELYFENKEKDTGIDISEWELQWVEQKRGVSEIKPFRNTMKACRTALK